MSRPIHFAARWGRLAARQGRLAAVSLVGVTAFIASCAPADKAADLDQLTVGMLVGRSPSDPGMLDVAFPGDMRPNVDLLEAQGKTAQLVAGVRIAEGKPILMLKLVHFSTNRPLGVSYMRATAGAGKEASHSFPSDAVTRQSLDNGELEFATTVPSHDAGARKLLDVILSPQLSNIEVGGSSGFTTFSPSPESRDHIRKIAELYEVLAERPDLIPLLAERALGFREFKEAIDR